MVNNLIGYKWAYKVKTHSNGSLEWYKARIVVIGFSREYGIDYNETVAIVAKMTTIRTLIYVATVQQWPLFQFDVKNTFFNGYSLEKFICTILRAFLMCLDLLFAYNVLPTPLNNLLLLGMTYEVFQELATYLMVWFFYCSIRII